MDTVLRYQENVTIFPLKIAKYSPFPRACRAAAVEVNRAVAFADQSSWAVASRCRIAKMKYKSHFRRTHPFSDSYIPWDMKDVTTPSYSSSGSQSNDRTTQLYMGWAYALAHPKSASQMRSLPSCAGSGIPGPDVRMSAISRDRSIMSSSNTRENYRDESHKIRS